MRMLGWAGLLVASAALGAGAVEAVRRSALQRSVLDIPNERSSHEHPVPRGGGLGLLAAAAVTTSLGLTFVPAARIPWLALAAALVAAVSTLDDLRTIRPAPRLAVHLLAASVVVLGVGTWDEVCLVGLGAPNLGVMGFGLSIVWVVGLTNAFNFMDGIDGIAGGQTVVAGATWGLAGLVWGLPSVALVGAMVAAATVGFLVHNAPPARIFMGDVGSATLGLTFAALPLAAVADARAEVACRLPVLAVLAVWPFVFDASATFASRAARREDVLAAHRSHRYQRLVIAGLSHAQVSLLYTGLAAVAALAGLRWVATGDGWVAIVALLGVPATMEAVVRRTERPPRTGPTTLHSR